MNARQDITKFLYRGSYDTVIEHNEEEEQWKMRVSYTNTTGSSESSLQSYLLGKHNWTIEMDKGGNKGKPYSRELKLTISKGGEFTCDDGQCVKMEERCDQVPHCRDKTHEKNCELFMLENGYNKRLPPMVNSKDPVPVDIRITVLRYS